MAGYFLQLRHKLLARRGDCAPRHDERTRCVGACGIRSAPGIAVHQPDARNIHTQYFIGDLGKRGFHALAVRMHAYLDLEAAIGRHPHCGLVETRYDRRAPGGKH
ncbi:hypothetical protein D9M72_617670 [compost metagenome]